MKLETLTLWQLEMALEDAIDRMQHDKAELIKSFIDTKFNTNHEN